jgi:hypothetical protein
MRTKPLKIYGGCFDGMWDLRVAATSWKEAVELMGNMAVSYAKRYGQCWKPRPEDEFLTVCLGTVFRCKATTYPRQWEMTLRKPQPEKPLRPDVIVPRLHQPPGATKMDPTLRMIVNLTGDVVSKIRTRFGVVDGMTPEKTIALSNAVGSVILDHMSKLHDVREITDKDGFLRIPPD